MFGIEPAGLGANVGDTGSWRVVNKNIGIGEGVGRGQQNIPFASIVNVAHAQAMAINGRLHRKQPLYQLLAAHLQTKDRHPRALAFGCVLGNRKGQTALAHARPRCQNDQVALLQTPQHAIQHSKASGHAHERILVAGQEINTIHHVAHDGAHGGKVAMNAAFADAKDNLLGAIHYLFNILCFIIGQLGNLASSRDQPA